LGADLFSNVLKKFFTEGFLNENKEATENGARK
jgi:hypothetical protein